MPLYKTRAIIIKTRNLGEADKIVTSFTERFGKVSGVAKGSRNIKSRFCGSLETFTYCNLLYFGKENQNLYRINSCDTIKSFRGIREDLKTLSISMYLIELVDIMLKEYYVNRYMFQFLVSILSAMGNSADPYSLLRLFEIRFMSILGYMPKLNRCAICNREPENGTIGFNHTKNGIVCKNCFGNDRDITHISHGTLKFLHKAVRIGLDKVERLKIPKGQEQEISEITRRYVKLYTNRELKSYLFMMDVMNRY